MDIEILYNSDNLDKPWDWNELSFRSNMQPVKLFVDILDK